MYVAMGDSITYGDNASTPNRAYPHLVNCWLAANQRSNPRFSALEVFAEPGWTSETLAGALLSAYPAGLQSARYVSIWVGGDDLAYAALAIAKGAPKQLLARILKTYGRDITGIVTLVRRVSRARIVLCTQYNPFPNTPMAGEAIAALNEITAATAARIGTGLAPVHSWFEGRQNQLISGYRTGRLQDVLASPILPIHPNNLGHRVIAQGLEPILLS